ncbi:glycosyltransferase family 4 protein [Zestomonas thermotolerans]|uniref:glycosyltransferase family 4 protein n=1 Tax=Zestomonas thermotolerans TaxID=157784 RepID=UPI0012DF88FF|nr:glycosyltransferase family 4 protein [Pseudomonas thermotolerans]
MKILKINRYDWRTNLGGDVVQMISVGRSLESMGHEVKYVAGVDEIKEQLPWCDIAHVYNLQRSSETVQQLRLCAKYSKKAVLSPIIADFSEINNLARTGLKRFIEKSFKSRSNIIKDVARVARGVQEFSTLWASIRGSHFDNIVAASALSAALIPNSSAEADYLKDRFPIDPSNISVIPNGVNLALKDIPLKAEIAREAGVPWEKFALCIARIDERKNILNLVKAVKGTEVNLLIVGKPAPLHQDYFHEVKKEILGLKNVIHLGRGFSQEELSSLYRLSHMHVLPSWLETPGLVSLEAGLFGNNLVVGDCPPVREYFDGIAEFCSPGDISSIREAIVRAYDAPRNNLFADAHIESNYSWDVIAGRYFKLYEKVLDA